MDTSDQAVREQREGQYVFTRAKELFDNPIRGRFDSRHLKAVHAYLFQDLPHHRPGVFRDDTRDSWIKLRVLEGQSADYAVHYAHDAIAARITGILRALGGAASLRRLTREAAASRLAGLYGDLDHAHGVL